jgi:hypothetical protein
MHDMDIKGARIEARLELAPRADTLVGTITGDDGLERQFCGWMELASAIEAWRTGNSAGAGAHISEATPRRPPRP